MTKALEGFVAESSPTLSASSPASLPILVIDYLGGALAWP